MQYLIDDLSFEYTGRVTMETNVARVGTEHSYLCFKTASGGRVSVLQPAPSLMLDAEVNKAKLTAYVSCPFVVLILIVVAFFG
jgi:hypothetical protein